MLITVAKTAGFCFGVNRAVETVYELIKTEKVCTLGPIIHNEQLVTELANKGARIINTPEECTKDEVLVIRSHGVSKQIETNAKKYAKKVVDATCPFVSKIHKICSEESKNGATVFIAGDPLHSEVLGIKGHCFDECFVFSTPEEFEKIAKSESKKVKNKQILVAQTTFNAQLWLKCQKSFKKVYTNGIIFDTICNATSARQLETEQLAKQNDVIIVVGGKHSSNTKKLKEVASKYCANTYHIETASELDLSLLSGVERVGIVAGASTPAVIIKEVQQTMTENANSVLENTEISDDMSFEEALEVSLSALNNDQKVKGTVLSVDSQEIKVDIGRKYTGIVKADDYSYDSNVNLEEEVKVGDVLDLIIMRTNDQEGTILLSKRRFDSIAGFDKVATAKEENAIVEGKISDVVKGGVVASYEGIRVFIPASQATLTRGESLEDLKGTTAQFRIIEIGRGRKVIGSIRSVLREQKKEAEEKFFASVEENKVYTGVVKSLTSYGAFVDLGGVDGMIHISELSWSRIKHPSEVVNVGDTVEVYVKAIDQENHKISLGFKKAKDNPWEIIKKYAVGDVVEVTVMNMTSYGAFARVIPGIDGLIHISQIANRRIEKPQDVLTIGEKVDAQITNIDFEAKRVSLSIRALLPEEPAQEAEEPAEVIADEVSEAPKAEVAEAVEEAPKAEEKAEAADAVEEAPKVEEKAEAVEEAPKAEEKAEDGEEAPKAKKTTKTKTVKAK